MLSNNVYMHIEKCRTETALLRKPDECRTCVVCAEGEINKIPSKEARKNRVVKFRWGMQ